MMIGMLGIMAALVWKVTSTPARNNHGQIISGEIEIPSGYEILGVSRSESSLFLILENAETGERLLQERSDENQRVVSQYQLRLLEKQ